MQVTLTVIVLVLLAWIPPVYPQVRKAFTINEISELIKSGANPDRIARFVEQYGVAFELDDRTLQRLKQDGAGEAVLSAVRRMSAQYTEERQLKIKEQEEAIKRQRQEEAKQKVEEQKRQQAQAERVKQAEEQRRQEERRLAEEKRRVEEEARGAAPPCLVGQKLQFRYDNGGSFSREITGHENNLCVMKNVHTYYVDKDWVVVKVVDSKGQTFESPTPRHTEIGEKWLRFPLTVGKKWEMQYQGFAANTSLMTWYQNHLTVLAYEEITVPAGTFKAFKIKQTQTPVGTQSWGVRYFWYTPEIGFYVKRQRAPKESSSQSYWQTLRDYELVSISPAK